MPAIALDNWSCHYAVDGSPDQPSLVLAHSLGLDLTQWDPLVPVLLPHFRVVRYDLRGHGSSGAPAGDYAIDQFGRDALGLADALGIDRFAFCGVSLGGMVGQWIAGHAPDRVSRLVIANATARLANSAPIESRRQLILQEGMASIVDATMARYFSERTRAEHPKTVEAMRAVFAATNPVGYAGTCAALRDLNQLDLLPQITAPTLVIGGDADVVQPWAGNGERIAALIPGARAVQLSSTHISNLDAPDAFNAAVLGFLLEK